MCLRQNRPIRRLVRTHRNHRHRTLEVSENDIICKQCLHIRKIVSKPHLIKKTV